eukprot:7102628-Alexandrium_andersonii.AAC.1
MSCAIEAAGVLAEEAPAATGAEAPRAAELGLGVILDDFRLAVAVCMAAARTLIDSAAVAHAAHSN